MGQAFEDFACSRAGVLTALASQQHLQLLQLVGSEFQNLGSRFSVVDEVVRVISSLYRDTFDTKVLGPLTTDDLSADLPSRRV
jgi:hypothetical protein